MRLFISLNFDKETTEAIVDLQESLRNAGIGGNYTKPENLHTTLAFIGEYGNPDDVLDVIESVPFRQVAVSFEGFQLFREMYLLRIERNPGLESYVRRLRRALAENDIPYDKKSFVPHITLIRKVSFRRDVPDAQELVPLKKTDPSRVSLMRSDRGKNGMIYTEIGGYEG